jgi:hypothetical protein
MPPPDSWFVCDVNELADRLSDSHVSLVEFWAPGNLFSRLLAPVRVGLPLSHGTRLRLLCCTLACHDEHAAAFGAVALPALVLFHREKRMRRWFGAIDVSLLRHEIDVALADMPSVEAAR